MNYIDIVILLFLLYGAFRGFSKGLIIEVATLAGLIIGGFHCHTLQPFYRRDIERLPEYHVPLLVLYRFGRYLPVGCDCSLFAGEDVDQTGRYYFVGVGQ